MHLGEVQRLLREYEPICICLQHIGSNIKSIGNYYQASISEPRNGVLGTAVYVHNKVTYDSIHLNNPTFQISAIRLHLPDNKKVTVCNLYNQPNQNYDLNLLPNMLSILPQPVLIVGDFNAHHSLWDENVMEADTDGKKVERLIINDNYCCLNESETNTYFSKTHGKMSTVDLSICSPSIVDCFEWNVANDLYTSDHYPIIISYLSNSPEPQKINYKYSKADWKKI